MSFHMRCGSELRRGTCAWMVLLLLAVAARAQIQETHIIGRVVDGAGNPIPGASVTLIIDDLFGASNREEVRRLGRQETDSEGKFQFRERYSVAARIWLIAWKANTGFGWTRVTPIGRAIGGLGPSSDSHTQEITLVAHKSLPVRLQIVDQEAKPITGGTVDLASVKEESLDDFPNITGSLPELRRTIDSSGFVTLDYLPPEVEALVLVDTPTFGRQSFQISRPDGTDTVTLRMQPLGKVTVTLSGDPEEIRRRRIEIFSARDPLTDPGARTPRSFARFSSGRAEAVTDEEGTATAMVAAGRVQVFVEVPPHAKSFAPRVREKALPPGGTLEISLTMRPRIRVQGMVVSEENAPISGVRIWTGGQLIQTDEQGKFEFLTSDEQVYATITYIPDGYAQPVRNYLDFSNVSTGERVQDPTAIVPTVTVPAVRLYKAAQVSGVVVDQTGTRVPGAAVHALWMLADENSSTRALKYANVRADENGEFTVPGIRKGVDVTLTAAASGMASLEPLSVHTGEPQKVRLEIHPHGVVQIEGRVKGSDGKPVPHPRITLMGERSVGELRFTQYRIQWDQGDYFSGDENGYFRTPTPVPRSAAYQLDVSAPGYAVLRTEARSATGSVLDFGEIILEKLRTVKGVVRDSGGQPVAKARLWAYASQASNVLTSAPRTECFTDSAGQFTLENLHPKAFYAIVEADGYRIKGFPIRAGEESAEVTLFRVDEAVPEQHRVRPIAWDTRQHEALVRKLLDGVVPEYTRSARFDTEAISILGRTDPMAALSMVESMQSPEMRARALALLGELDDALAEAENVTNAMRRAMTNLEILDHINDRKLKQDLLAKILSDASRVVEPDRRVAVVAKVAEGFWNLGEREKSRQILQQHLEQVNRLSPRQWSGYVRGLFAEQLARFDLEVALKLVEELEPAYQARHLINIAHIMGSENPPAAEMVLKRVNNNGLSQTGVVRVVYRMAPVDLPRAMRLVQNIDVSEFPADRSHALGVMAYALKDQDPQKARKLLRQALEELPFPSTYGNWRAWQIFGVGFTLARFAEEIDPDNLTDYFWQALARAPTPDLTYHVVGQWMKASEIALLAKLALPVAQYDAMPGMAQQLAEPIFQYLDELAEGAPMALYDVEALFTVIALVHPDRAVDWAIRYHKNLPEQRRNDALQPWLILSRILTSRRWEIGQSIDRSVFYLWTIDRYDL